MRAARALIFLAILAMTSAQLMAQEREGYLPLGLEYGMSKIQAISALGEFSEHGEEQEHEAAFDPDRHDVLNYHLPGYLLRITLHDDRLVSFSSDSNSLPGIDATMAHHGQVVSEMDRKLESGLELVNRSDMCSMYRDGRSYIIVSASEVSGRGYSGISFYEKEYFEESPIPRC